MRLITSFCFVCLLYSSCLAQSFLPKTEDIPQMQGLMNIEEIANFDNPDERLLILNAESTKSISEIQKFYETNLKNLGWVKVKENYFKRANDTFQIEIKKVSNYTQIQFILAQE